MKPSEKNSVVAARLPRAFAPALNLGLLPGGWQQMRLALSCALLVFASTSLFAQEWIATTSGSFQTTTNWSTGVVPGGTSTNGNSGTALFDTATGVTVTNSANRGITSINFDTNAGSFTLTGSTFFFASGGGINLESTLTSTGQTETISSNLTAHGSFGINSNAPTSDILVISGGVTTNSTTAGLTLPLGGTNTGANAVNGVIANGASEGVSVLKTGTGSWTLGAANTYSGSTTVTAGTVFANGVGNVTGVGTASSALGTGTISVTNAGTVLGGTGNILGAVTVASGAILQGGAGAASGTLTLASTPVLSSGSVIGLTLGTIGTHSSLALPAGFNAFQANQSFTLAGLQSGTYDGIITGVAAGITTSGWTITNGGGATYSFLDDGLGDIDLTVTVAVPEPSTYVGTLILLGAVGWQWYRRGKPARG